MISLPLTMRPADQPQREPVAWLILGADPVQWLDELINWPAPLTEILLYVVPVSLADRRARALLAVPPAGHKPRVSGRCRPYGRVAGRLYLPIEARFQPEVADSELAAMLEDRVYVMHPAAGLVAFDKTEALPGGDLLQAPVLRDVAWGSAQPGVGFNQRLLAVMPQQVPTVEQVLREGREDIGSKPVSLEPLPPAGNEPSDTPAGRAGRRGTQAFARFVRWLAQKVPARGSHPTWVNRLEQWASGKLSRIDQALEHLRHKELNRLLHLLETDPDKGLQHAIGLGSDSHRGLAAPSSQLGRRQVDFNWNRLRGGGPADFWEMAANVRLRLTTRYRQLAQRELNLGRHRRAAYIHAELLGDLQTAAAVLKQGGHWREAALLYQKKLNRPREAAACLEQGGLLGEAVQLYEELGEFEKAGDLYARLEQRQAAQRAYRRAVGKHIAADNFLKAADLLETTLDDPDEALLQLDKAWPDSNQAGTCLHRSFAMLGRLGRHEEARRRIRKLPESPLPPHRVPLLTDALGSVAATYPDQIVQGEAADATRVVAAERLAQASLSETEQILAAVRRLVPEDRLLGRDCQRFAAGATSSPKPPRPRPIPPRKHATLLREFRLPGRVRWQSAQSIGSIFYAAGCLESDGRLVVARANWEGAYQLVEGPLPDPDVESDSHILLADFQESQPLLPYGPGAKPISLPAFAATDRFPNALKVGVPDWMPDDSLGVARSSDRATWVLTSDHASDGFVLSAFSREGRLIATRQLPQSSDDPWRFSIFPVPMIVPNDRIYLGVGHRLVMLHHNDRVQSLDFPGVILSLAASSRFSRRRVAATFQQGGVVYWGEYDGDHLESFGVNLTRPVCGFTKGGLLIATAGQECQIHGTSKRRLKLLTTTPPPHASALAVLATNHRDRFALCMPDGKVCLYHVPLSLQGLDS